MKRTGGLFEAVTNFPNLLLAYKKARRGAIQKQGTQFFSFHLEQELFTLQEELQSGQYQPRPYHYFKIYDPKERTISVADFRDRVVHHAIINVLEPIYEKSFIYDSYATRKNKGTHKAVKRAQQMLKKNYWFFKTDIDKYFDSIRHDILLNLLKRKIKDRQLILLCEKIIRLGGAGVGLPIGNLTSQFLANVYLNDFDYFVKQELKAKHYIRYMDDFVLFSHDRIELKAWKKKIKAYLTKALALQLKDKATFANHAQNGLTFLGRRIFPNTVRMARPNLRRICTRMARREKDFQLHRIDETTFLQSMNSYWAILEPFPGLRSQLLMDNQQ